VIPLRDLNPTRSTPVMTYLIIAANTLVYLFQSSLDPYVEKLFVMQYGLVPALFGQHHLLTPLTSMFMHGGFWHLALNMWSLLIFGDNVEERLGGLRYLAFYLLAGFAAAAAQIFVGPDSVIPMVGASGAIAGVMAAYMRLFPRARVVTLIFIFVREVPAVAFIAFWFLLQVWGGIDSLGAVPEAQGSVAVFAHIGGFVAGLWLIRAMLPARNATGGFRRPTASVEQFPS
jgi:membrane associated rhomboid family serine protease